MEEFESRKFKAATRRHLNINLRAQLLASASSPVVETLSAIGGCTLLVVAGDMIRRESLTPSVFMTFLALLFMLYDPIRKLNKVNIIVQEALAATDRVNQMLSTPVEIRDEPNHQPIEAISQGVSFENVSFAYGEKQVLRNFNLTVEAGEVVALVGSSGAGKSTVVNLLPRFFDPASGTVRIDGVDIRDLPLKNLRSLIGLVTQDTMLFNDSVRNNIAYGRSDLPLDEVRRACRSRLRRRIHRRTRGRLRNRHRRIRPSTLRRPAPAPCYCPSAAQERAHPDSRRSDIPLRLRVRTTGSTRGLQPHGRSHRAGYCASPFNCDPR